MTQENKAFQLPDNVLAIFMLINLPSNEFHNIIQSLFSNKLIPIKQVTDRLVSEAALLKNSNGKESAMYRFKGNQKLKADKNSRDKNSGTTIHKPTGEWN